MLSYAHLSERGRGASPNEAGTPLGVELSTSLGDLAYPYAESAR